MPKEWILNSATNRFQLNFKRNVGPVSYHIRLCQPKSMQDWRDYYFRNVFSEEHLKELGRRLYVKITEVLVAEISEVTEQDYIDYVLGLVIDRTYDGYVTEIKTIYGQLEKELGVEICPACNKWDRLYNVDFYISVGEKYIGLQIKPAGEVKHIPQIFKERSIQEETHRRFASKYGGRVFYVISISDGKGKRIHNLEVVDEIRREITRLGSTG
jgi:hypothetical protein